MRDWRPFTDFIEGTVDEIHRPGGVAYFWLSLVVICKVESAVSKSANSRLSLASVKEYTNRRRT